jgi:hypothetical protein
MARKIPYWRTNRLAWEKPTVAGKMLPGTVKLAPFGPKLNVQEGAASGKDGGKLLIRGMKFARATFTLTIDTEEDWDSWIALAPILMPVTQPQARDLLAVHHPLLAKWNFTRGLVEDVEETEPSNGGPLHAKIVILMAFERDDATHSPAKTSAGKVAEVSSIPLAGDTKRPLDVRDRARPKGPR